MRIFYDKVTGKGVYGYNVVYQDDPSEQEMRPAAIAALKAQRPGAQARDLGHVQILDESEANQIMVNSVYGLDVTMRPDGSYQGSSPVPMPAESRKEMLRHVSAQKANTLALAIADPTGATYRGDAGERELYQRDRRWEIASVDPDSPPDLPGQIAAARAEERTVQRRKGAVDKKIETGVYTTKSEVLNAAEWTA